MKVMRYLPLIILLGSFCCTGKFDTFESKTKSKDSTYVYGPLKWELKIPDGYEILTKNDEERMTERGIKAMRETVGEEFEVQPFYDLISFRKDKMNIFLSNSQVIDSVEFPSYSEVHDGVVDVIMKTYEGRNIKVNHKRSVELIDNIEFTKDDFELLTADGKYFMNQAMYTRLFDAIELTVTITWNNEDFGREMLDTWKGSKFGR
jgi:hypothetical protein